MQTQTITSITVIARRWFHKGPGNTYFSASILVNGEPVHTIEYAYGYGEQYLHEAFRWLDDNGYTERQQYSHGGREAPWIYCQDRGITLHHTASDVSRKKDLSP
jgi:hypothetical protein